MKQLVALFIILALFAGPIALHSETAKPSGEYSAGAALEAKHARWTEMEKAVRKRIATFRGEVGLVIKDLKTGWTFSVNPDKTFPSASMVKVPIMAACLKAAEEGRITLQDGLKLKKTDKTRGSGRLRLSRTGSVFTVEHLLELMVTRSDNTAANMIIDLLGFDYLNSCFREMGLETTNLARRILDARAREKGMENYTTAREMAAMLEEIYRKSCVCSEVSEKCLDVLKLQEINDRIPRLLPRDTVVAHKTGLERQVCHDAGIIFTEKGDLLISVFTRTWRGPRAAKTFIANASSLAYKTLQEKAPIARSTRGK